MKTKTFNVGDKVFAKVKGYPAWPACITGISGSRYNVQFYGTSEVATCKPSNLFYYLKHKQRFLKNQKRKDYLESIEEIDVVIKACGGVDGNCENAEVSNTSNSGASVGGAVTKNTKKRRRSRLVPKKTPRKKRNTSNTQSKIMTDDEDSDNDTFEDSELQEGVPDNEKSSHKLTIADIKITTTEYLGTVISYYHHVRKHPELYQTMPPEVRPNNGNELLLVKTKSGEIVGMRYNTEATKKIFSSEFERADDEYRDACSLLFQKTELENGKTDLDLYVRNLDITETQIKEALELDVIARKKQKLDWLKIENKLAELDTRIKQHLGLTHANPEAAIEHLDEILTLKVQLLMLIKHPGVFDMVKRLRKYIGNAREWNFTDDQRDNFNRLAEKVREKAEAIYQKFVQLLDNPGDEDPWDVYLEKVAQFKEQISADVECSVFALTSPPYSRAAFFDKTENIEELQEMVDKIGRHANAVTTTHLDG